MKQTLTESTLARGRGRKNAAASGSVDRSKRGLRLAGVALAASTVLAGCGSTAATPASPSGSGTGGSAAVATFDPSAAAPKANDGKRLKIGVTFPVLDQFLQGLADGMKVRAEADGVDLVVVAAQEKTDVQLGQVENFVSQHVDGIIIIPVDTDAAAPMTAKVTAAKIPVAYVNRRPSDLPAGVPYVGSDSLVAGQLEMEALAGLVGQKGNVAILQGDPSNEAAQQRTKGCQDVVDKYPNMKVVKTQAGNWYRDKGLSITENWLQSGEQVDVICSNNDEMALGAIQALTNAGKTAQVKVGGVDATSDALAAMKAGTLAITVFQDAKGQGAGGVDAIVTQYNKGTVPAFVNVPYQLVTPATMAAFVNK